MHQAKMRVCSAAGTKDGRENHEIGQCPTHVETPASCIARKCPGVTTIFVMRGVAW